MNWKKKCKKLNLELETAKNHIWFLLSVLSDELPMVGADLIRYENMVIKEALDFVKKNEK